MQDNKEEPVAQVPAKVADKNQVRLLKIKTSIVRRIMKDFTSYKNEEGTLKEKLEKMKEDESKDEYDVKKMMEQVQETTDTLVQCKPRIESAMDDLEQVIATQEEKPGEMLDILKESTEWAQADSIIAEAKAFVDAIDI